ncbi:glycosyltransferase [Acuticoccus sediminis]|uniref:glycosyltransferase n=1 Tax=Acuticoccus sediminis TaxID=2184697 RepID=UPI001CFEDBF8|nr:glycosyltransferase [Acuticoccus sediminis]
MSADPAAPDALPPQEDKAPSRRLEAPALSAADQALLTAHFDAAFYLATNPDVAAAGKEPLAHYMAFGEREGRAPRPGFDPAAYRAAHPELADIRFGVFLHALAAEALPQAAGDATPPTAPADAPEAAPAGAPVETGAEAGAGTEPLRTTSPAELDPAADEVALVAHLGDHMGAAYLAMYPDVAAAGFDPVIHYVRHGEREGRRPTRTFDPAAYRASDPALAGATFNLFWHFLCRRRTLPPEALRAEAEQAAETERRRAGEEALVRAHFDTAHYLATYPDIARSGIDPVTHYLLSGETEGRSPRADFDPTFYRVANPDIADEPVNLFWHYLAIGQGEGRPGAPAAPAELDPQLEEARLVELLRAHISDEEYLAMYPDVAAAGFDPVTHYVRHGEAEGRWPTRTFDPAAYRASDPALADAPVSLFWHFLAGGGTVLLSPEAQARAAERARARRTAEAEIEKPVVAPFFDADFYLAAHPEADAALAETGLDPLTHYLVEGEARGWRPAPGFNPDFYRRSNPDLAGLTRSVFWHYHAHGKAELRTPEAYYALGEERPLRVSAIVPNYNHARFLDERIRSIAGQTYPHIEIVILDDASTDDSAAVIERIAAACPRPVRVVRNETNAGNVFAQWEKGVGLATGDLVWICESDDFCAPDFAEHLVRHFHDESVTLAFGRIEFARADGTPMDGMDGMRRSAEALDWTRPVKRPAAEWFANAFGVRNVIANVGGAMFRRQAIPAEVWTRAKGFRISGDWYLYSRIAGGGQIVYEPDALAHFRQHGENTSASNFTREFYYREYGAIMLALCESWDIPAATREKFLAVVAAEFEHFGMPAAGFVFEDVLPVTAIRDARRTRRHVQIGFLGFHSGGGEVFAIRLAALLHQKGFTVSMIAQNLTEVVPEMRAMLPPAIPVYTVNDMAMMGRDAYLKRAGIDLVHSHINAIDSSFFSLDASLQAAPYVLTLHGSHDFLDLALPQVRSYIAALAANASAVVYTADKNLQIFDDASLPRDRLFKIANAMVRDTAPFERTREELGIADDAVVFTFVARGIERKGWRVAVMAFQALKRARPGTPMHLLLVGDGEKADVAEALAGEDAALAADITFLGYQSRVNGIYRLSDCAILPTRYPGESAPLCLIQAAQEGLPVIASAIGEIPAMLTLEEGLGGVLVPIQRDTAAFADAFSREMGRMLDPAVRTGFQRLSGRIADKFQPEAMLSAYLDVYAYAGRRHAAEVRRRARTERSGRSVPAGRPA